MDRCETNLEEGHHGESPVGFSQSCGKWVAVWPAAGIAQVLSRYGAG